MEVETTEYEPCETGVVEVKDFVPGRASKKARLVGYFFRLNCISSILRFFTMSIVYHNVMKNVP